MPDAPLIDNAAPFLDLIRGLDRATAEHAVAKREAAVAENKAEVAEARLSDARIELERESRILVSGVRPIRVFAVPGTDRVLVLRYSNTCAVATIVTSEPDFEAAVALESERLVQALAIVVRPPDPTVRPDPYLLAIGERLGLCSQGVRDVPGDGVGPTGFWTVTPKGLALLKEKGVS